MSKAEEDVSDAIQTAQLANNKQVKLLTCGKQTNRRGSRGLCVRISKDLQTVCPLMETMFSVQTAQRKILKGTNYIQCISPRK